MTAVHNMLGHGVYSVSEAARLTGLAAARVRRWFVGSGKNEPLLHADYSSAPENIAISFRNLVDAYVASQFARAGLRLAAIRRIYGNLQVRFGSSYAFCHEDLRTDGTTVFLSAARETGDDQLTDLLNNQRVMPKILQPFLSSLDFEPVTKLAMRWRIAPGVVVDPQLNFGKPVLERVGVATHVVFRTYVANCEDADLVARWFDITEADVQHAVQFERDLAA